MAESHGRSSSSELLLKLPGCSHYRRQSDTHHRCQQCRLNEGLTLCTQTSPHDVCKDWLPEAWEALEKAAQQKRKRKAAAAARAAKKTQEMDDSIELQASKEGIQVPPAKCRDDGSSKLKKRAESASSSKATAAKSADRHSKSHDTSSKAMEAMSADRPSRSRDKKKSLLFSVSAVVSPTAAQCLSGPAILNTMDHVVVTGADEVTGQTDTMPRQGPATRPDLVGVGSGPGPRHREGPALEPGTLI